MSEPSQADSTPESRRSPLSSILSAPIGLSILVAGVTVLAATAVLEARFGATQAWSNALFMPEGTALWEDTLPISVRKIPLDNFPVQKDFFEEASRQLGPDAEAMAFDLTEWAILLDASPDSLELLLESGRVPAPGESSEVLAGALARLDKFTMEGTEFRVVGRIRRGVPGLSFAYLFPRHESLESHFGEEQGATNGWLDPEGMQHLRDFAAENDTEGIDLAPLVGQALTETRYFWATLLGLALVAAGGAIAQMRLLVRFRRRGPRFMTATLESLSQRSKLLLGMHVLMYGGFFSMMLLATALPLGLLVLQTIVSNTFQEGELSAIGAAYAAGNIPLAAVMTWAWNYLVATVTLSVIPSLLFPFWGVAKNLLSFLMVGFVMSPVWTGSAAGFVYHSITMTLELEAYIIVSFAVSVLPIDVFRGVLSGKLAEGIGSGLKVVGGATVLAGLMLAVAASYEAVTLILFR